MAQYRNNLPQLSGNWFITDGGLETTLIFHQGWRLPEFAAFDLLKDEFGTQTLEIYFRTYIDLALHYQVGLILESATWRANPDWGAKLGYSQQELADLNYKAIALLHALREAYETATSPMAISGCIGPRGDGYNPTAIMSEAEAESYHRPQIETFLKADADLVTAMTINYVEEAIGIVRAAQATAMPAVISFTVETDGKLPTGQSLPEAIAQVDSATDKGPIYYMVNCAHPTHLAGALKQDGALLERIRGLRANSSRKSHAELNESTTIDEGNPRELGEQYRKLKSSLKNLNVLGGCCGTDYRHVEAICQSCLAA